MDDENKKRGDKEKNYKEVNETEECK